MDACGSIGGIKGKAGRACLKVGRGQKGGLYAVVNVRGSPTGRAVPEHLCYHYSINILKNSVFRKLTWGEFLGRDLTLNPFPKREGTLSRLTPGVRAVLYYTFTKHAAQYWSK
jgi:hypothetical protein